VAQSVELVLDPVSEAALLAEWDRLAVSSLPTMRRRQPDEHHRPHITLYAASQITAVADARLPDLFTGLDLQLRVGALTIFGPRRGSCILVRQVVPSVELLTLQRQVAQVCGADPEGQFGAGRWTPHVTLARRIRTAQLGAALEALSSPSENGGPIELSSTARQCRRWDGDHQTAWWLTAT
jgi:2'-5' RNA ligase